MKTIRFRLTHSYEQSQAGIEIPIRLIGNGRDVRILAKVDTGASFCIFQREFAEHLGIDVESGIRQRIGTAAGGFDTYGHSLTLSCFDWEIETTVYFAALPAFPRNVVGQSGWLQHFRIGIIHEESVLYLSHYDEDGP